MTVALQCYDNALPHSGHLWGHKRRFHCAGETGQVEPPPLYNPSEGHMTTCEYYNGHEYSTCQRFPFSIIGVDRGLCVRHILSYARFGKPEWWSDNWVHRYGDGDDFDLLTPEMRQRIIDDDTCERGKGRE